MRPGFELARPFGLASECALRGELGRKWTRASARGAYRERRLEAEWTQAFPSGARYDLILRSEDRRYAKSDTLTPSYVEAALDGNLEVPVPLTFRAQFKPSLRRVRYTPPDSLIFRDNWTAEGVLQIEASLARLRGHEEEAAIEGRDWTWSAGVKGGVLRNRKTRDSDHGTFGGILQLARENGDGIWLDLTCEAGRRSYRVSGGSRGLQFEGINIALSGTDYSFVSVSAVAEAPLPRGMRLELFGLADREKHSDRADDFSLWSFTAALVRTF